MPPTTASQRARLDLVDIASDLHYDPDRAKQGVEATYASADHYDALARGLIAYMAVEADHERCVGFLAEHLLPALDMMAQTRWRLRKIDARQSEKRELLGGIGNGELRTMLADGDMETQVSTLIEKAEQHPELASTVSWLRMLLDRAGRGG